MHYLVPAAGGNLRVEPRDKTVATVHLGVVTGEHVVRLGAGPRLAVALSKPPRLPEGARLLLHTSDDPIRNGSIPMSISRVTALMLSLV